MRRALFWKLCWIRKRRRRPAKARTQRVGGITFKHPIFLELLAHPLIVAIWQAYLADDAIICSTWSANTAYPGFDKYGWHPDFPYWWINQPWPLERVCGQTIWLLDDFTEENGGTGFLPNSHLKGHPPPKEMNEQWQPKAEILTGVRGSALVFHGALWHTARPNRTDKARSALLGMYTRRFSTRRKICWRNWQKWRIRQSSCSS